MGEIRQGRWAAQIEGDFVVWRRVGRAARTGIWHETYLVRAGEYEAIYGNMPPYGLAKASSLVPGQGSTARTRLRAAAARD